MTDKVKALLMQAAKRVLPPGFVVARRVYPNHQCDAEDGHRCTVCLRWETDPLPIREI